MKDKTKASNNGKKGQNPNTGGKSRNNNNKQSPRRSNNNTPKGKPPLTDENSSKQQRRAEEEAGTADKMYQSEGNPVMFYNHAFPKFTEDAARIPFAYQLGYVYHTVSESGAVNFTRDLTIPGVMRIGYHPVIGNSQDKTSAINRAAQMFYTYLRNVQRAGASKTYDAPDTGIYLVGIDALYAYWALMVRAYRTANTYSPINLYYPEALLTAMGFDTSIVNHLAEFRAYINRFAINIGRWCVPKGITFIERHQWMNSGIYSDAIGARAQTYVFVPEGFWQYDNTVTTGSELKYVAWNTQPASAIPDLHTLEQVKQFGDNLLNIFLGDEDTANISGDIYANYGEANLMTITEIGDLEQIIPIYDELVLAQIENASFAGSMIAGAKISQNPNVNQGAIISNYKFSLHQVSQGTKYWDLYYETRRMLNIHSDNPTPEQIIEATRLMSATLEPTLTDTVNQSGFTLTSTGTEVCSEWQVYRFNPVTKSLEVHSYDFHGNTLTFSTIDGATAAIKAASDISNFDWHPFLDTYQLVVAESGNYFDFVGLCGDTDNLTQLSYQMLDMLHEAATLNQFDVPQMAFRKSGAPR